MYLAWDVGLINLAYCLSDKDGNIIKWDTMDLTNRKKIKCEDAFKNGKRCTSNACGFEETSKRFLCKRHSNGLKCKNLYTCFECKTKCKYIHKTNNEYVCAKHMEKRDITDYCELINNKNVTKTSLFKLGKNLIEKLDEIPEFLNATTIDIENQPCLKNPTMKSIQMILYSYFLIRLKNTKISMSMVSAKNKLKFEVENDEIKEIKKITKNYEKNKKLAVAFTKYYLANDEKWLTYFKTHDNKKDDLADTYMMIRYRLKTI